MIRHLIVAAVGLASLSVAKAATLDGIVMPDLRVVDGAQMRLNGIGLRTYSVLGIHIYVAGLYLERRSDNPDNILHSPERKVLDIRFVRDVGSTEARAAWRDGLENNCRQPACSLDPRDVERFLASVPSIHKGDETILVFTSNGVTVTLNGQPMGDITDPHFAETMLATFIGPVPPTPRLKHELLGDGK
jgi:Chalcone isomerase-like